MWNAVTIQFFAYGDNSLYNYRGLPDGECCITIFLDNLKFFMTIWQFVPDISDLWIVT